MDTTHAVYPFTVDVRDATLGVYLVHSRHQTIEDARAAWLTLTLDGEDAQVTRHAGRGEDEARA